MKHVSQTLQRMLSEFPGLELAFLFGSHAHGTARPDSDIDLGVLFRQAITAEQKLNLIEAIASEFGCAVDIVDLHGIPEPVTGEVMQGRRLIGTDAAHARLLYRHLLEAADFLPLRQRILDERGAAWLQSEDQVRVR